MAELDELLASDRDWLSALKPSIRTSVEELIMQHGSPELAAEQWLSAVGSPGVAPLGAVGNPEFKLSVKSGHPKCRLLRHL